MRKITYLQAITEAIAEEMERDSTVYLIGQCARGQPFGTHKGLYDKFGGWRVLDAPVSESAIVGSAIGAAMAGYRPVIDMLHADFFPIVGDELLNQAAKWRFVHGGQHTIPMVVRGLMGGYVHTGAHHSQCTESLIMHTPGLKIAVPSNAYDAKGLLKAAIRDNNPVIYFEHKKLMTIPGEVPDEDFIVPFGVAEIKRKGSDVTAVATGYMVKLTLEVAEKLQIEKGISVEVVDPRTLEPLDTNTIVESVRKTGRVVIVDEDTLRCSVATEIAMQIMENAFSSLKAPIKRVGAANYPVPGGPFLEELVLPSTKGIADAIESVLN